MPEVKNWVVRPRGPSRKEARRRAGVTDASLLPLQKRDRFRAPMHSSFASGRARDFDGGQLDLSRREIILLESLAVAAGESAPRAELAKRDRAASAARTARRYTGKETRDPRRTAHFTRRGVHCFERVADGSGARHVTGDSQLRAQLMTSASISSIPIATMRRTADVRKLPGDRECASSIAMSSTTSGEHADVLRGPSGACRGAGTDVRRLPKHALEPFAVKLDGTGYHEANVLAPIMCASMTVRPALRCGIPRTGLLVFRCPLLSGLLFSFSLSCVNLVQLQALPDDPAERAACQ